MEYVLYTTDFNGVLVIDRVKNPHTKTLEMSMISDCNTAFSFWLGAGADKED